MSKAFTLGVLATSVAVASAASVTDEEFQAWVARHNKSYESDALRKHAFTAFTANVLKVHALNSRPNATWVATVDNQFGDLTPEEFRDMILSRPLNTDSLTHTEETSKSPVKRLGKQYLTKKGAFRSYRGSDSGSESFDWTEHGAVTRVQDQGSVGTCWAFSTIGNIEGQWFLSTGELVDLSEEFLVDCDGSRDDAAGRADCGVFGGWPYLAYQFLIDTGGVPTEATNPYCCGHGDCYPCMNGPISLCGPPPYYCDEEITAACPSAPLYAHISDWHSVSSDEEEMKTDLEEIGPLSALLDATQLQYYKSGIWEGSSFGPVGCSKTSLNHAIVVTGFGQLEKESVAAGSGSSAYWRVKNSWGEKWGEEGYFRIVRGEGMCGINTEVTTSAV